jgi:hypothetical protein
MAQPPPYGGPPPRPVFDPEPTRGSGAGAPPRLSFEGRPSAVRTARPKLGLILGGGCAVLLILGGIAVAVFMIAARAREATTTSTAPAPPPPTVAPVSRARVDASDLREVKDGAGRTRFAGELKSTGTEPVGVLAVTLTVFDAARAPLESGACVVPALLLAPGEKLPCNIFLQVPRSRWKTFQVSVDSRPPPAPTEPVSITVLTQEWTTRSAAAGPNVFEGKLRNATAVNAREVRAIVSLYGADGRLVGGGFCDVPGGVLPAGATGAFRSMVQTFAPPRTFTLRAVGYR